MRLDINLADKVQLDVFKVDRHPAPVLYLVGTAGRLCQPFRRVLARQLQDGAADLHRACFFLFLTKGNVVYAVADHRKPINVGWVVFQNFVFIKSGDRLTERLALVVAMQNDIFRILLGNLAGNHAAARRGVQPRRARDSFLKKFFAVWSGSPARAVS